MEVVDVSNVDMLLFCTNYRGGEVYPNGSSWVKFIVGMSVKWKDACILDFWSGLMI